MDTASTTPLPLPRLIAITGQEGSGKDSYGNYLASRGYLHISAGDVLRERARTQGFSDPLSREVLSQIGDEMKQEFGPSPITESSLRRYEQEKAAHPAGLVISGLRREGELKAFKARGAVVLWIETDETKRFANLNMRARDDTQAYQAFVERSKKEYYGDTSGGKDGVHLQAIEALADCSVKNNGSLEDLYRNCTETLTP